MNNYSQEIINLIKEKVQGCKDTIAIFKYEQSKYRDVFNTFDKFEAKNHEYWRARILGLEDEIADLEDILKEIDFWEDEILKEEIRDFELAEEDLREERENAKYGI